MVWLLALIAVIAVGGYCYYLFVRGDIPSLVRSLRWVLGGGVMLLAALFGFAGRVGIASLLGAAGAAILLRGQLGPIDFTTSGPAPGANSRVRSRFFEMRLDHETGQVSGSVISGTFAGHQLIDIGEDEMRTLLQEAAADPDSLSLLETWLDANRQGWREYFGYGGAHDAGDSGQQRQRQSADEGPMDEKQACDILGLKPGASVEEIKAAHHRLLKAVHPDQGGSNFLASRINAAKDFLLKKRKAS